MTPILIVTGISLLVVLTSSASLHPSLLLSVLAPLVVTSLLLLLHLFFSYDEPHPRGWPIVGAIVMYLPSAGACILAVIIRMWLKGAARG